MNPREKMSPTLWNALNPVKTLPSSSFNMRNILSSSLITLQDLVAVSHTVHAYVGGPTNVDDAVAPPPGTCGVACTLGKRPSPYVALVALNQTAWT